MTKEQHRSSFLPPVSDECDRRLSRAAREILVERILPLLEHHVNGRAVPSKKQQQHERLWKKPHPITESSHLWNILDAIDLPTECPLQRKLDVYEHQESRSLVSSPLSQKVGPRRTYRSWFHCGICGKSFVTRYYLDLHMDNHHNSQEDGNATEKLCLADTVCPALGGCSRVALELEPYYGRGSGGAGPDGPMVKREWSHQIEKCNPAEVEHQMKPKCRQLISSCFSTHKELHDELTANLCDTLSCHSLIHRADHIHPHMGKADWIFHSNHTIQDWLSLLVIVCLTLYYLVAFLGRTKATNGWKRNDLLLQKNEGRPKPWYQCIVGSKRKKQKMI